MRNDVIGQMASRDLKSFNWPEKKTEMKSYKKERSINYTMAMLMK